MTPETGDWSLFLFAMVRSGTWNPKCCSKFQSLFEIFQLTFRVQVYRILKYLECWFLLPIRKKIYFKSKNNTRFNLQNIYRLAFCIFRTRLHFIGEVEIEEGKWGGKVSFIRSFYRSSLFYSIMNVVLVNLRCTTRWSNIMLISFVNIEYILCFSYHSIPWIILNRMMQD